MGLEAATFVGDLDASYPEGTDERSQGDDHIRLLKAVLQGTFPGANRAFRFPSVVPVSVDTLVVSTQDNALFLVDATGGAKAMTLPSLGSSEAGFRVSIVKTDASANGVTVTSQGAETISGGSSLGITGRFQITEFDWTGDQWIAQGSGSSGSASTVRTIAGSATLSVADFGAIILADPTTSGRVITLPTVAGNAGKEITVKLINSTNTVTVAATGSEKIDDGATVLLSTRYNVFRFYCDGTQWRIIADYIAGSTAPAASVPAGMIAPFAQSTAPTGWLECNGGTFSSATFPNLFAALGSTTLPDLRGQFLRGWDHGKGLDVGRTNLSTQLDAFQGHFHTFNYNPLGAEGGSDKKADRTDQASLSNTLNDRVKGAITDGSNGVPRTAKETRPVNVALMFCIKT